MPLIKGGSFVADPWRDLADDEALPEDGKVIVSHKRWLKERDTLLQSRVSLGLRLPNDVAPATLAGDIQRFDVIPGSGGLSHDLGTLDVNVPDLPAGSIGRIMNLPVDNP